MKIYNSIENLIGNTPLVRLNKIEKEYGLNCTLLAKLESFNPAGSAKDRIAKFLIDSAEKDGLLKAGATVIEPTSGNTGIGIALISASRGYNAVIVMPDTMSEERIKLIKAYGAKVVLTDGALGMQGAIDKAQEIKESTPNSMLASQFTNPNNPLAHYLTTGKEIYNETDGLVDIFIAGIGTGGTITGVSKYLKEKKSSVKVYGVEPTNSPIITKGVAGAHGLQGIGAGFIPKTLDLSCVDKVFTVTENDAYNTGRKLARCEGVLVGISSGAALYTAIEVAKLKENENKVIVVLLPDGGEKYLSVENYL
ncbi:MAG: cysteine synthase A [Clostridia bacterium]|nr:cysteine synthase A [Clostridia bacterium]